MKASYIGIVLLLAAVSLPACRSQQPTSDPAAVVQDFYAKLSAGDLNGAMEYVPAEPVFHTPYDLLSDRRQVAEYYETELGRNTRYELTEIEVEGNEVNYVLIASSDLGVLDDAHMRALVEDGMLISIRIISH